MTKLKVRPELGRLLKQLTKIGANEAPVLLAA